MTPPVGPASASEAAPPGGRLERSLARRYVGLDVARCLALLGMVATHVLDGRTPAGDLTAVQWLAGGRASALFAVLAGVTVALATGGRVPVRGRTRALRSAGLAARVLLVALLGLLLGGLDSGIAVILTYYGVLFLLGLPFVGLRARWLALLAAAWVLLAPVLSHLVRPDLPERQWDSPRFEHLAEPGRLLAELGFTGYYPAVPWAAYLLAGMALGRADLRNPRLLAALAAGGAVLAVVATRWSHAVADPALREEAAVGVHGATPTDDLGWLLLVAPHSGTPFDLAQTVGSALLVIAVCLLVERALPRPGVVGLAVLLGAGAATLTLYSLHVVMRTPDVWPREEESAFVLHVLVLLGLGALLRATGLRGPLEWVVGLPSRVLRRSTEGRCPPRRTPPPA